jgi:hypothetical protein
MGNIRLMRRADSHIRRVFKIQLPSGLLLTILILLLSQGDASYFALPLATLMFSLAATSGYLVDPHIRTTNGSLLAYYRGNLLIAVVLNLSAGVPAFGIAIPALFIKDPLVYTLWCGMGYPFLAFLVKKSVLSFLINHTRKSVNQGNSSPHNIMKLISSISFNVSVNIMTGNVILLYMSETLSSTPSQEPTVLNSNRG